MNRKLWLIVDGLLLGLILVQAIPANGQALPTVTPETNWVWVGIAVLCVFAIAVAIWLLRDHPGAVAKAKAETSGVHASFETMAHRLTESLHNLTETHAEAVTKITTPIPVYASPVTIPAEADVVGKAGTPGTFRIAVTGDPKADLAAMQAQYFG